MNKAQITKAAKKMISDIEWASMDGNVTDLFAMFQKAEDAKWDDKADDAAILNAVYTHFAVKEAAAKAAYSKLLNDLEALRLTHLEDGNVASENIHSNIVEGTATYWVTYFNACCQVVATGAENEGVDINGRLGYGIY